MFKDGEQNLEILYQLLSRSINYHWFLMCLWLRIVVIFVLSENPLTKSHWSKLLLFDLFPLANCSSCEHTSASLPLICSG